MTSLSTMLPDRMLRPAPDRVAMTIHAFDPANESLSSYMRYKSGGLHSEAERVRRAGRRNDKILIHVNKEEFEQLRKQWGDPIINPNTGLPEYGFFSSLLKVLKKVVPIVSTVGMFVPGLNIVGMLGDAISTATGMGTMAGNVLAGAGLGGFSGGTKGAVVGGIGGWASTPGSAQNLGSMFTSDGTSAGFNTALGRGLVGAGGAAITGNDPLKGGLGAIALGGLGDKIAGSGFVQNRLAGSPLLQQGALGASKGLEIAGLTGGDPVKGVLTGGLLGAAQAAIQQYKGSGPSSASKGALQSATATPEVGTTTEGGLPNPNPVGTSESGGAPGPAMSNLASTPGFSAAASQVIAQVSQYKTKDEALNAASQLANANPDTRPVYDAMKNFTMCDTSDNFGACLSQNWGAFNASVEKNAPKLVPPKMATGGLASLQHLAVGGLGDGQDDQVPARLNDGDFIVTADVVSGLGSGSTEGGVKALNSMMHGLGLSLNDAPSDGSINALLSNGEYRIPREAVASIGGGSIDKGAAKLQQMMKGVRTSYRSAHADKIPPKAKAPLAYMRTR